MSQEPTGIPWLLSSTNFLLSSPHIKDFKMKLQEQVKRLFSEKITQTSHKDFHRKSL